MRCRRIGIEGRYLLGCLSIIWILLTVAVSAIGLLFLVNIAVATLVKILINSNATIRVEIRHFYAIGRCCCLELRNHVSLSSEKGLVTCLEKTSTSSFCATL